VGASVAAAVTFLGLSGAGTAPAAHQQPGPDRAALLQSLPKVTELPSGYRPVGQLAGRGHFYTLGGAPAFRIDDGGAHHGSGNTAVWAPLAAKGIKGRGTQGILYRVEDGAITGAGYLIRQADLIAGKSFRGVSFREIPLPAAQHLTIDLVRGATADSNQYLWLWHFLPQEGYARHMLPAGKLPSLTSLPGTFSATGMDVHPKGFYPRMGRHHRNLSRAGHRRPDATGDESVLYGDAAGKLIFIEYTFSRQDFAAGVSWPAMPLNGVPTPPIDNLHIMHYTATKEASEYYTVHMYFIPEERYLSWETEPPSL
jgi:hypothetical protein